MRLYRPLKNAPSMNKNEMRQDAVALGALMLLVAVSPAAIAQTDGLCVPDLIPFTSLDPTDRGKDQATLPINLEADEVESVKDGPIVLKGSAFVQQGTRSITADEIRYSRAAGEAEAEGSVSLTTRRGDQIKGDFLRYKIETGIGHATNADFKVANPKRKTGKPDTLAVSGRGTADRINFEGEGLMRLLGARYSTCVEGQDDVMIVAKEVHLDQATGVGTAKNAQVRFFDTPIFAAPRFTFPISDERKSGFLAPVFGSEGDSGFVFGVPYYWNLAPNRDATLIPKVYADRGLMLQGEFRYLDENFEGTVRGAFLPDDSEFTGADKDRGSFVYEHDHRFNDHWTGAVDYQWASDAEYYDDFSNDIGISGSQYLPQRARVNYRGSTWNFGASVDGFQSIDDTLSPFSEPHDRLPRVTFSGRWPRQQGGFNYALKGEVVNFDHDLNVAGTRIDLTPSVTRPMETIYGYVTPRLALRHTSYAGLDNLAAGADTSPSRTAGVFSVDSGIFFERDTSWQNKSFVQTLEPRVFYVYAQDENQDDLPTFDTGVLDLNNFANFFRDNRFSGADRVEDANRITLALTSRLLDGKTSREWVRASIGQIFYFDDRDVVLRGGPETESDSDIVAQITAKLREDLVTSAFLQWDPDLSESAESRFDIVYRPDARRTLGLGYRFRRDSLEQANIKVAWPLGGRWSFYGRHLHDLDASEALESFASLEYNACCWALRVGGQRRVDNDEDFRNAFLVEFELVGLTRLRTSL